ncbi:MAG: glycosyl transferase family 2 [unclassified Hahellaceae]|nr:glycosyl transferase family 2 [Hahellaceae bacterium]
MPLEQSYAWEVPSYNTTLLQQRSHDWCVVIPVINEGKRIQDLLGRMLALGVPDYADIIIADGGSSDDSLRESMLSTHRVRALLVKTGPGKLSAQLRCAYSFALEEGYRGVVTIDGNNKDDPKAIPEFIRELENGTDFVQGSRYIPGGVAERTPLIRDIAIRLIHAPMLSLFSGFRWTDTTQGFRAYSSTILRDRNIAPFRGVFNSYELLAYLSYRVPKCGYSCKEVPSTRRYPKGPVPTKISSFKGNLLVLQTLVNACLGRYNP